MEEREELAPSRLQGAFRNYLKSGDSAYEYNLSNLEKECAKVLFVFRIMIFSLFVLIIYSLTAMYSEQQHIYINMVHCSLIWPWFIFPVFHKYIPWRHFFDICRRIFCCLCNCCSTLPTEDREIQTIENTVCQPVAPPDANEEQLVYQSTVIHDGNEEQTALLLFRKYLSWRKMFEFFRRIFCCPWCRRVTVDTEDQGIQTEEQTLYQPAVLQDRIGAQTTFQPDTLQAESDENIVSTKKLTEEQRLLQFLLGSTE